MTKKTKPNQNKVTRQIRLQGDISTLKKACQVPDFKTWMDLIRKTDDELGLELILEEAKEGGKEE